MTAPRWIAEAIEATSTLVPDGYDALATALIERLPLEAMALAVPQASVVNVMRVLSDGDPEVVELAELYQGACRALDAAGVPYATGGDDGQIPVRLNLYGRILWLAEQRPTRLELEPIRRRLVQVLQADPARSVSDDETLAGAADLIAGDVLQLRGELQRVPTDGEYERRYGNAMLVLNHAKVPLQIEGIHISLADRVSWLLADQRREIDAARSESHTVGEFLRAAHEELTLAGVPQSPTDSQHMLDSAIARRVRALRDERDHLQKMYEGASDDLDRERSAHQEAVTAASNREIALTVDLDNARAEIDRLAGAANHNQAEVDRLRYGIRALFESDLPAGDLRRALAEMISIDLRDAAVASTDRQVLRAKVADQAAYIEQLEAEIDALEDEIWEDAP